jgi:rhamnose utilization protein RhaD (predicted bifunctional aldolase and dehydrogenase)
MQSAWNDRDAEAAVARYEDFGRDVALRVYTTRLLGQDPRLVLHGGGNTSVKTEVADLNGDAGTCSASRAPAGIWARSSRPACRRCGWRR